MKTKPAKLAAALVLLTLPMVSHGTLADGIPASFNIALADYGDGRVWASDFNPLLWSCAATLNTVWPYVTCTPKAPFPGLPPPPMACHASQVFANTFGEGAYVRGYMRCNNQGPAIATAPATGLAGNQLQPAVGFADLGHVGPSVVCQARGEVAGWFLLPPKPPYAVRCFEPEVPPVEGV